MEGKTEGEINAFEKLYNLGILTKEQFEEMASPLREKSRELSQSTFKVEDEKTVHRDHEGF